MSLFSSIFGTETVTILRVVETVDGHGNEVQSYPGPGIAVSGVDVQPRPSEEYTLHRGGLKWQADAYFDADGPVPGPRDHVVWRGDEYRVTRPPTYDRGTPGLPATMVVNLERWVG